MLRKTRLSIRVVSVAVLAAFCLQEAVWANPDAAASKIWVPAVGSGVGAAAAGINDAISDPAALAVPFDHAMLKEVHRGTNGKLLIHIQDAHANYSGQLSLARALEHFMKAYGRHLVLVEGSSRDVTLDEVKKIADPRTWKIAARRFLQEGLIAGEEYLNLTSDLPIRLRGIEYRKLYDESLEAYAQLVEKRKDILAYLHRVSVSLDSLKNRHYPKTLLDYETKLKAAGPDADSFQTKIDALKTLLPQAAPDLSKYPETKKLFALQDREKSLRFDAASRDQERLLADLSAKGFKDQTQKFLKAASKSRSERVSQAFLLKDLLRLAEANAVALAAYPNLKACSEYLDEFLKLDMDALFVELELLEDEVYKNLLPKKEARKLRAIERFLGLLDRAYRIRMSSRDFETLKLNEPDFDTKAWEAFMNGELIKLDRFEDLVVYKPYLEEASRFLKDFYRLVDERDKAFLENTRRILDEEKTDTAYLVAGGYHTDHLKELMKREGYSYAVLTPFVSEETNHSLYEKILLQPLALNRKEIRLAQKRQTGFGESATTLREMGVGRILPSPRPVLLASRYSEYPARASPKLSRFNSPTVSAGQMTIEFVGMMRLRSQSAARDWPRFGLKQNGHG